MNLKEKIFSFGIFGREVSVLSKEELHEAKFEPWAEILSPQQLEEFRNNFTMSAVRNDARNGSIPENYIIRMSLVAWRCHLFGPNFIVTNRFYFLIVDHLLKTHEFVALSTLREAFKVDPKTMFYICKKLAEKGLIQENREGREVSIRLSEITANTGNESRDTEVYRGISRVETDNLVFYDNIPFVEQLKIHVERAENGLDSKDLLKLTGMRTKFGLKHLQRLCQLYPERFKLVSSIDNKHTVFKCFAVENLERRNARKLERMKGTGHSTNGRVDTLLSSKDRQSALQILAERLGHFNLSKGNMGEISRMTGYPYEIDRKNILSNAKAAGLQVFTIPQATSGIPKYIIALPKYDASIIDLYVATPSVAESNKFCKKLVKFFLNIESCVVEDNGYPPSPIISSRALYSHLNDISKRGGSQNEYFDFDYQTVMKMSVGCFYKTVKIRTLNFRARCTFEIFKARPSFFSSVNIKELFVGTEEPRKLSPDIFLMQDELRDVKMECYVKMLPDSLQDSIREFAKPNRFVKGLRLLVQQNLIGLNVNPDGRIFFKIVEHDSKDRESSSLHTGSAPIIFWKRNLDYNKRCEFLQKMRNATESNFMELAEEVASENFSKSDQRLIHKHVCVFAKIKYSKGNEKFEVGHVFTKEQQDLYLLIKKAVVFQLKLNLASLAGPENVDIEDLLDYMNKKEIITGFKTANIVSSISIHLRFRTFLGDDFPDPGRVAVTDEQYLDIFFNKVVLAVRECGSIDFDALLSRIKFLEDFELGRILELKSDVLKRTIVDGFVFISLANLSDPFS